MVFVRLFILPFIVRPSILSRTSAFIRRPRVPESRLVSRPVMVRVTLRFSMTVSEPLSEVIGSKFLHIITPLLGT